VYPVRPISHISKLTGVLAFLAAFFVLFSTLVFIYNLAKRAKSKATSTIMAG